MEILAIQHDGDLSNIRPYILDDLLGGYPLNAIKAVSRQAGRYGEQTRLLEDSGMQEDRTRVRKAWRGFLDQFETNNNLWWLARSSYYDAYAR